MARSKTIWVSDIRNPLSYIYNNAVRNTKSPAPLPSGEFRGVSHYVRLVIRQFSFSSIFSARASASSKPYHIFRIFFWCYPAQVADRVVGCIPIPMRHLVFWRWRWPYKCYGYNPVNVGRSYYTAAVSNVHIQVPVFKRSRFEYLSCLFSTYVSSIRYFIVRKPNRVFPNLLAHGGITIPHKFSVCNEVV